MWDASTRSVVYIENRVFGLGHVHGGLLMVPYIVNMMCGWGHSHFSNRFYSVICASVLVFFSKSLLLVLCVSLTLGGGGGGTHSCSQSVNSQFKLKEARFCRRAN